MNAPFSWLTTSGISEEHALVAIGKAIALIRQLIAFQHDRMVHSRQAFQPSHIHASQPLQALATGRGAGGHACWRRVGQTTFQHGPGTSMTLSPVALSGYSVSSASVISSSSTSTKAAASYFFDFANAGIARRRPAVPAIRKT